MKIQSLLILQVTIIFLVATVLSPFTDISPAHADVLKLKALGQPRSLQRPIFGASTTAFYEHLLDDPTKIAVLKTMAIGLDRFLGGSDANFYNWRTGLIEIQEHPDSSPYVRFWAKAAANIARGMPKGVRWSNMILFLGR